MPTRPFDHGLGGDPLDGVVAPSRPSSTLAVWKYWPTPSDLPAAAQILACTVT